MFWVILELKANNLSSTGTLFAILSSSTLANFISNFISFKRFVFKIFSKQVRIWSQLNWKSTCSIIVLIFTDLIHQFAIFKVPVDQLDTDTLIFSANSSELHLNFEEKYFFFTKCSDTRVVSLKCSAQRLFLNDRRPTKWITVFSQRPTKMTNYST